MHIADGVLSLESTVVVTAVSLFAFYKAIKTIKEDEIPLAAVASAMFFIASFIHIPFGVTQIHLILLGEIGIFLGLTSFISIFIALVLQALLLGYGGVVSIGVNLFIMAAPAVLVFYINKTDIFLKINEKIRFFLIGFLGAFFATLFLVLILYFSKDEYEWAAYSIFSVNIVMMVIEGFVSMFLLLFIKKTYPKILKGLI
ncbi:cobalt/nickel ECF transporter CbiMNQO, S component CbiM [Arcobacter venerupis]|jgi:cobalt/nickel transport system permease protein|uniref:Cobalt/nickel ECF transporter CbiMNQO, S component CbiM n=1 Tax=Arcobacter venerupis TaxID=1054033 RepID=A0AAE7E4B7_9BACT|nr:cobalt transporter CbiM [Arcobacter venerupis]QKF66847.1 cobalt/nickel ECF transporter CbiMNQO, S component CbiM [Arcobacter venerupis]RWS49842.1 cobalamin biosynthesis protein [Arcobacter venerupis]